MIAGTPGNVGASALSGAASGAAIGSVVPGIGTAIGGAVGGGLSLLGGLFQNQGQQNSINQQEQFQQSMSSSAYQRAVADMKAADLNPALMYGSGGPESTPSGASATPSNVLGGVGAGVDQGASLALGLQKQQADIDLTKASTASTLLGNTNTANKLPIGKLEGDFSNVADMFMPIIYKYASQLFHSANSAPPISTSPTPGASSIGDWVSRRLQTLNGPGQGGNQLPSWSKPSW